MPGHSQSWRRVSRLVLRTHGGGGGGVASSCAKVLLDFRGNFYGSMCKRHCWILRMKSGWSAERLAFVFTEVLIFRPIFFNRSGRVTSVVMYLCFKQTSDGLVKFRKREVIISGLSSLSTWSTLINIYPIRTPNVQRKFGVGVGLFLRRVALLLNGCMCLILILILMSVVHMLRHVARKH